MIKRRDLLTTASAAAAASAFAARRAAAQTQRLAGLPDTMVWATYDVGSTGYVEASAIADALGRQYGTRVRLQPSGTSIGRILPVKQGRAPFGWLANELYFAMEGLYEFGAKDWGPQDMRVLMGRVNAFSVVATRESGITKPEDLRGKRLAYVPANSSVNIKIEPILAFAGLTMNALQIVQFPSYGASLRALIDGRADAAGAAPAAAVLRELEASPRGISWVALDPANREGWRRAQAAVPFVEPFAETIGAGLSDQHPVSMMGYRYPMITVQAAMPEAEVYAVLKAIAGTFDLYKAANPIMPRWDVRKAGTPPMDAAFHAGAIRYLKEIGVWTADSQAWQDRTLRRHQALQAAWRAATDAGKAQNVTDADWPKFWSDRRAEALRRLAG